MDRRSLIASTLALCALTLIPAAAVRAEETPPPEDGTGPLAKRVLLIGDSHTVGTFGEALDTLLRSVEGNEVLTVGSCGLSPNGFLDGLTTPCGLRTYALDWDEKLKKRSVTPTIDALLAQHRPATVIVALGANQIRSIIRRPAKQREDIRNLAAKIKDYGARCLWVGPPHGRNKPPRNFLAIYTALMEETAPYCDFFDARPDKLPFLDYEKVSKKSGLRGDGGHYDALGQAGRTAVRKWALAVFRFYQSLGL